MKRKESGLTRKPCLWSALALAATLMVAPAARAGTGTTTYPSGDNISFKAGTLECWIELGFDPSKNISPDKYRSLAALFTIKGERGGMNVYMYTGASFKNAYGWACSIGGRGKPLPLGARREGWKKGEWHHVALVWKGRNMALYLDGKKASHRVQPTTVEEAFGAATDVPILIGDRWGRNARYALDDLRLSTIARGPEELGFHGKLKPDPYTSILDDFEKPFKPDGKTRTKPAVMFAGEGGLPGKGCAFVEGKFGKGLALYRTRDGRKKK